MVTKTKVKEEQAKTLDLEEKETKVSELNLDIQTIQSKEAIEEGKKRLHEIAEKMDQIMDESRFKLKNLFKDVKAERGLIGKIAVGIKGMQKYFGSMSDRTTMESSLRFLTEVLKALNEYNQEIPGHIENFKSAIKKLETKKTEIIADIKLVQSELKKFELSLKELKAKQEKETDETKKEVLIMEVQKLQNHIQNIRLKGGRSVQDLKNLNLTTELYLSLKGSYEILLRQVYNLTKDLQKHKENLETIGPSVDEVQRIVLTMDKFSRSIDEYRQRDNEIVKLSVKAINEITPAIQDAGKAWFNEKTVADVKEGEKKAKKTYEESFGTDIKKLEEYKVKDNKVLLEDAQK